MTAVWQQEGAADALATNAEAKAFGNRIKLWHRDVAAITLFAMVLELTIGGKQIGRGRLAEVGMIRCFIGTGQTGFSVMTDNKRPITEGDKIEYPVSSGRFFFVPKDEGAIQQKAYGYVYVVEAHERKTITGGTQS